MPRKTDQLAALASATVRPKTRDDVSTSVPQQPSTRDGRKVRVTVDLEPLDRRSLHSWCAATAERLGLPAGKVGAGDVLRALLAELHADDQLAERVTARLIANRS